MMQKIFNISNLYITLWCLYFLQGTLYTEGSIISRSILFSLLVLSMVFFAYANVKYKLPVVLYILDVLIVSFSVYGIVYMLNGEQNMLGVASFSYLKYIYMSLLPVYAFYTFTRLGWMTESGLQIWAVIFLIVAIFSYYFQQKMMLEMAFERGFKTDDITNNAGYIMVGLIPLSVLYRDKLIIHYIFLAICLGFTLFAMKRGAILTGLLCSLWLLGKSFSISSAKQRIVIIIFTIVLLIAGFYGVSYLMQSSEYFVYRVEKTESGDSSGRDFLYRNAVEYLLNVADTKVLLFGAGANATINLLENYAHNDWLEILINNGILVACVYVLYWLALLLECFINRRNEKVYLILTLFFIISFLRTFFSMSYNDTPIYLSSVVGFALALPYMRRKTIHKHHIVVRKRVSNVSE